MSVPAGLTILVGQVVNVCYRITRVISKLPQAKLKDFEGNCLVLQSARVKKKCYNV